MTATDVVVLGVVHKLRWQDEVGRWVGEFRVVKGMQIFS